MFGQEFWQLKNKGWSDQGYNYITFQNVDQAYSVMLLLVYFVFIKKYYKGNYVLYCMPMRDEQFDRLILLFFSYFDFFTKANMKK